MALKQSASRLFRAFVAAQSKSQAAPACVRFLATTSEANGVPVEVRTLLGLLDVRSRFAVDSLATSKCCCFASLSVLYGNSETSYTVAGPKDNHSLPYPVGMCNTSFLTLDHLHLPSLVWLVWQVMLQLHAAHTDSSTILTAMMRPILLWILLHAMFMCAVVRGRQQHNHL